MHRHGLGWVPAQPRGRWRVGGGGGGFSLSQASVSLRDLVGDEGVRRDQLARDRVNRPVRRVPRLPSGSRGGGLRRLKQQCGWGWGGGWGAQTDTRIHAYLASRLRRAGEAAHGMRTWARISAPDGDWKTTCDQCGASRS